jgi:hypothetical protein
LLQEQQPPSACSLALSRRYVFPANGKQLCAYTRWPASANTNASAQG